MVRTPPRSTRADTLFPYTTLFRSGSDPHAATLVGAAMAVPTDRRLGWLHQPSFKAGRSDTRGAGLVEPTQPTVYAPRHPRASRRIARGFHRSCKSNVSAGNIDRKSTRLNSSH